MAFLVTFLLALHLTSFFVIPSIVSEYQWLVWDYTLIVSALVNSILFFLALPYKRRNLKIAAIIIVMINIWFVVDYTIIWRVMSNVYSDLFRYVFSFSLFTFLATIAAYAIYRVCSDESEEYSEDSCFIVHRAPKDFIGLIGSIFKNPEGLTFIVVRGQEYRFSHGKVVCKKHNTSERYTYKCVRDINDKELGKIKSLRWSLRGNCFTVFKRYDRKPRSA